MSTLHLLTKKSIYSIHRVFKEEVETAPSPQEIEAMRIDVPLVLYPEEDVEVEKEVEAEVRKSHRGGGEETEIAKSKKEGETTEEGSPSTTSRNEVGMNNQNITETVSVM